MKRLKLLRQTRMMSQSSLAEQLFLSQQSINRYENGLAEPDINTLIKIADLFHTSVDYLIEHDNTDTSSDYAQLDSAEKLLIEIYHNSSSELKKSLCILFEHLKASEDPPAD